MSERAGGRGGSGDERVACGRVEYHGSIMNAVDAMGGIGSFMAEPWLGGREGKGPEVGRPAGV